MTVYNETKTTIITEYDLTKGYLKADKLFIAHHDARPAVKEQGHYETIATYANGGKDVEWVVDVEGAEERAAYDEYEDIQVYIPYTEKQLAEFEIAELKRKLADTDYKAIKFAEGAMTAAEYEPTMRERQSWRDRINELEGVK